MRSPLLVCAPLRCEAAVIRGAVAGAALRRTGYGARASTRAARLVDDFDALAVAGVAGGVSRDVLSGDLVVASEVRDTDGITRCSGAPLFAAELRRAGLRTHCGPIISTSRVVRGSRRAELADHGALAVDLESAPLARAACDQPLVVLRAVVDTALHPLARPGTPMRAVQALARLRRAAALLPLWARAVGTRQVLVGTDPAAAALAATDLVLALPGSEVTSDRIRRVTHVGEIRLAWLWQARTIGVVAGSSTADTAHVRAVTHALRGLGPVSCTSLDDRVNQETPGASNVTEPK